MTKEQAIERLKIKLDNDKKYLEQCNPFSDLVNEVRLDNKSIEIVLSMLKEKDKIIDLMLEGISKNILNTCPLEDYNYDLDCENKCNDNYKECWKQYFENKAKELINR